VVKEYDKSPHHRQDFSLGKFRATLDCFCIWQIGTLVDSMHGNPMSGPIRTVLSGLWKNPNIIPSSKEPLPTGDLDPYLSHSSLASSDSKSRTASQSVQPFFAWLSHYRQTDRQTDRQIKLLRCSNRLHLASAAMQHKLYILTANNKAGKSLTFFICSHSVSKLCAYFTWTVTMQWYQNNTHLPKPL